MKDDIDALAKNIAGIDDLGEDRRRIEKSAKAGEPSTSKRKSSPGSAKRRLSFERYDGAIPWPLLRVQTDAGAAQEFIESRRSGEKQVKEGSFEGVDYKRSRRDDHRRDRDFLVIAEDLKGFKAVVDASERRIAGRERKAYETIAAAPVAAWPTSTLTSAGWSNRRGAVDAETEHSSKAPGSTRMKPPRWPACPRLGKGRDRFQQRRRKPPSGNASTCSARCRRLVRRSRLA